MKEDKAGGISDNRSFAEYRKKRLKLQSASGPRRATLLSAAEINQIQPQSRNQKYMITITNSSKNIQYHQRKQSCEPSMFHSKTIYEIAYKRHTLKWPLRIRREDTHWNMQSNYYKNNFAINPNAAKKRIGLVHFPISHLMLMTLDSASKSKKSATAIATSPVKRSPIRISYQYYQSVYNPLRNKKRCSSAPHTSRRTETDFNKTKKSLELLDKCNHQLDLLSKIKISPPSYDARINPENELLKTTQMPIRYYMRETMRPKTSHGFARSKTGLESCHTSLLKKSTALF